MKQSDSVHPADLLPCSVPVKTTRDLRVGGEVIPAGTELAWLTSGEVEEFKRGAGQDALLYDDYHNLYGMNLVRWRGRLYWVYPSAGSPVSSGLDGVAADSGEGVTELPRALTGRSP